MTSISPENQSDMNATTEHVTELAAQMEGLYAWRFAFSPAWLWTHACSLDCPGGKLPSRPVDL